MTKPCTWCTRETQATCPDCGGSGFVSANVDKESYINATFYESEIELMPLEDEWTFAK